VADHAGDRLGHHDRQVQHDADQIALVAEVGRTVVVMMAVVVMAMAVIALIVIVVIVVIVVVMVMIVVIMIAIVAPVVVVGVVSHRAETYSDAPSGETGAWP
jgi:hypothetical protein